MWPTEKVRIAQPDVTIFDTKIIDFVVVSLTLMVFGVGSTTVRTTIYAHTKGLWQVHRVIFFFAKAQCKVFPIKY